MVTVFEWLANNSPIKVGTSVITKNSSVRKSLRPFSDLFDVKHETVVQQLGYGKIMCRLISKGNYLWSTIKKYKGYTKNHAPKKICMVIFTLSKVCVVTNINYCVKVSVGDNTEKQVFCEISLQFSIGKLQNSMVSTPEEGVLREVCYEKYIIISVFMIR